MNHPLVVEALEANKQCITDFIKLYKSGCALTVLDEAAKSLETDALKLTNAALSALSAPLQLTDEQATFESHFANLRLGRNMPDGSYNHPTVNDLWRGWQARVLFAENSNSVDVDKPVCTVSTALEAGVQSALEVIQNYGGIDGDHHKTWVIDQVCRALLGDGYAQWVIEMKAGEDGPNTYRWDEGIAP